MPHFHNDILVVTKDELIPSFWSTYNALKQELWRYRDLKRGIKRFQAGGNGRQLLVIFDSLPKTVQEELGDPRIDTHPLERFYKIDPEAYDYYNEYERPGTGLLKPSEAERYITNASVMIALMELENTRRNLRESRGKSTKNVLKTIFVDSKTFQEVLKLQGSKHTLPTNYRRFKQKYFEFKTNYPENLNDAFISIITDPYGRRIKNSQKVCENTVSLLNNLFATQSHKPTAAEVSQQYQGFLDGQIYLTNMETGELYNPEEFKELSESTVRSYLNQWQNRVGNFSNRSHNRQKFMTDFIPYHKMAQPTFAGSIISIDDRQPPFMYKEGSKADRVWFYLAVDLASQAVVTWVYAKKKADLMPEFYRQLVRCYHAYGVDLPDGLECESSLNSSYRDSFLKNGAMFQDVRIEANSARSKRIEAYFSPMRYGSEKKREGWIARPFALSESNQQDQTAPKKYLEYDRIVQECLKDIEIHNNTAHNLNPEMSRWDYFMQNQNPNLKPTKYKNFLPSLGYHTESSCKAGIVKLQYGEYVLGNENGICTGEELISIMKVVEGGGIDIYWLDDLEGNVMKAIAYKNGRYICELHPMPVASRAKIENTPETIEARSIMSAYQATVTSFIKLRKSQLESIEVIDNRPKVLNNNFKMPGLSEFEISTEEVESAGLKDEEDDVEYIPNHQSDSEVWKQTFL